MLFRSMFTRLKERLDIAEIQMSDMFWMTGKLYRSYIGERRFSLQEGMEYMFSALGEKMGLEFTEVADEDRPALWQGAMVYQMREKSVDGKSMTSSEEKPKYFVFDLQNKPGKVQNCYTVYGQADAASVVSFSVLDREHTQLTAADLLMVAHEVGHGIHGLLSEVSDGDTPHLNETVLNEVFSYTTQEIMADKLAVESGETKESKEDRRVLRTWNLLQQAVFGWYLWEMNGPDRKSVV